MWNPFKKRERLDRKPDEYSNAGMTDLPAGTRMQAVIDGVEIVQRKPYKIFRLKLRNVETGQKWSTLVDDKGGLASGTLGVDVYVGTCPNCGAYVEDSKGIHQENGSVQTDHTCKSCGTTFSD